VRLVSKTPCVESVGIRARKRQTANAND